MKRHRYRPGLGSGGQVPPTNRKRGGSDPAASVTSVRRKSYSRLLPDATGVEAPV